MVERSRLVLASVVARDLGVSHRTVKRWIRKRTLAGRKVGGRWYVTRLAWDKMKATLADSTSVAFGVAPGAEEASG